MTLEFNCPSCHTKFTLSVETKPPRYCPFCSAFLNPGKEETLPVEPSRENTDLSQIASSVTLIHDHFPEEDKIRFTIGSYQVLDSIGKGGMGEVYLAYDTTCGRKIALKRIRPDLMEHPQLHNRFLKEARITSQLTHPAIIPIYSIQEEKSSAYYTMPFVQGETLKQIFRKARLQEKKGEKPDQLAGSIPALVRLFLSVCQAVAYSHSKGVLHRDLKPENVIIGQYGQVVILDWGLAKLIGDKKEDIEETEKKIPRASHQLTHIGRVVGTVAYMAPERAMGNPANEQTDIYSLGVILYQILTLKHPFQRNTLKEFRQEMDKEKLVEPAEVAPYRDVPRSLSRVVMRCLASAPEQRYQSVDELIHDLQNYIEGRSEWFPMAELSIHNKADWEFQENVLIAEHVAITREAEISDWVSLMISKASFLENTKIEASLKIGPKGQGVGFLLSIPEEGEREHLNDGYCLWLSSDLSKSTKLLRSTVEVMHSPDIYLQRDEWYRIRIEKIDNNIHFYLNDILQFSYISHIPLAGTHVGLLSRDGDFSIKDFIVYAGSQNVTVNCLAVPDAFLAHKDYYTALNEYRRIGYSFSGRAEGREAMFRAGVTLLEQANDTSDEKQRDELYDLALQEFEKLHGSPGAPLEYLGKALVYQALHEYEEEAKCFELAFLRYPNHPLLPVLKEQIVYRMHKCSLYHRKAAYNFILLAVRYLPNILTNANTRKLFLSLDKHWESLFFLELDPDLGKNENLKRIFMGIKLSFWLAKPYVLVEFLYELSKTPELHPISFCNALFCLIELGSWELAEKKMSFVDDSSFHFQLIQIGIDAHYDFDQAITDFFQLPHASIDKGYERILLHLVDLALLEGWTKKVHMLYQQAKVLSISPEAQLRLDCQVIWAYLLEKNWIEAGAILHKFPIEFLSLENTPLFFLYGCWLYATEGKDIALIHLTGVLDVTYPHTWTLLCHYLKDSPEERKEWLQKAFLWERRQLYRQLALFTHCKGDETASLEYQELAKQEFIHAEE